MSKRNSNAAEVIIFLHRLVQVLVEYFKELEEESIRDNFVIIYELMDEMMDFGYPQTTESKILQECVHITRNSPSAANDRSGQVHHPGVAQTRSPSPASHRCHQRCLLAVRGNQVSQERGLFGRYRERQSSCTSLDATQSSACQANWNQVNASGNVVRSEILGAVKMKCYLSGMPELRLGLNDKVMFESTGRSESTAPWDICHPLTTVALQHREARRLRWRT